MEAVRALKNNQSLEEGLPFIQQLLDAMAPFLVMSAWSENEVGASTQNPNCELRPIFEEDVDCTQYPEAFTGKTRNVSEALS